MARRRQPDGRPSIYQGADGQYHCWVTIGTQPDGKPKRRHIRRRTATEVAAVVDELLTQLRRGAQVTAEPAGTVAEWLRHWLEHVVRPNRAWGTWYGYRSLCERHIIPAIGSRRLKGHRNVLTVEHVERLYTAMGDAGYDWTYVRQVHRVLSRALRVAERRGRADRNACALLDGGPTGRRRRTAGFELDDAQRVLTEAVTDPMAARWLLGLLLGPRQGEALGVRWPHLHLDTTPPYLALEKQLQRRTWAHGCDDPVACARPRCRTKPCPPRHEHGCADRAACKQQARWCPQRHQVDGCSRHRGKAGCPPPCTPTCVRHASSCPQRHGGGLVDADLKTAESERPIPLPPVVADLLVRVREDQIRRGIWREDGYVFADEAGRAIDPRRDHDAWKALLRRAGVPARRLHAARNTAASMLLATGSTIEEVQELLGHTDSRTTKGYADVAKELKAQAVNRVAEVLLNGDLAALLQASAASRTPPR